MSFRLAWITVFKKELGELLRDRRAMFVLLAPPFLLPAIFLCFGTCIGAQFVNSVTKGYQVAVTNPDAAPELVQSLAESETLELVDPPAEGEPWGEVLVVLTLPDDLQARLANDETVSLKLTTRDATLDSTFASGIIETRIERYNNELSEQRLKDRGLDRAWLSPLTVTKRQAPGQGLGQGGADEAPLSGTGSLGTLFIPLAVISWLVGGGLGLLVDTTVGEKERRTIEALLLTPASRLGIVAGKMGVVFLVSVVVMSIWLLEGLALTLLLSTGSAAAAVGEGAMNADQMVMTGVGQVLSVVFFLVLLIVPFIITLNSLMMAWCTFASNYREASLLLFIMQLALPALVFVSVLSVPSDTPAGWYMAPLMGLIVAMRDLFSGVLLPTDMLIALFGGALWSLLALTLAAYIYSREWALVRGIG